MHSRSWLKVNILLVALAFTAVLIFAGSRASADENAQATENAPTEAGRFPLCPPGARLAETPTETPTVTPR